MTSAARNNLDPELPFSRAHAPDRWTASQPGPGPAGFHKCARALAVEDNEMAIHIGD